MSDGTQLAVISLNLTCCRTTAPPIKNERNPPFFSTLPQEILNSITKDLSYASTLALRYTCRMLYANVRPYRPPHPRKDRFNKPYRMTDLLEIERWPWFDYTGHCKNGNGQPLANLDFYACYICLRLRSAALFSKSMVQRKLSKRSPLGNARPRSCIPCGIRCNMYKPGTKMYFGGSWLGGWGQGEVCWESEVEVNDKRYKRSYVKWLEPCRK